MDIDKSFIEAGEYVINTANVAYVQRYEGGANVHFKEQQLLRLNTEESETFLQELKKRTQNIRSEPGFRAL